MSLKRILLILLVCLLFVYLFKPFERNMFNVNMKDEEDNFITGTWLNRGRVLYKDMFFQHQPSLSIISAQYQNLIKPNTIYMLVKKHRELVFLFSFLFLILLTLRFGFAALVIGAVIELTKFNFLGNTFLAESVVIYPVIFVALILLESVSKNKKIKILDGVLCILFLSFVFFTLLPMVPFVIFCLFLIWKCFEDRKKFFYTLLIVLLFSFIILYPFVSFKDYFFQTIIFNWKYFIPYSSREFHPSSFDIFLLPFKALFFSNDGFYLLVKILSLLFLISTLFLVFSKRFLFAFLGFILLISTNFRPLKFGLFYEGFHFLPWFAALVAVCIFQLLLIFSSTKSLKFRTFSILSLIILVIFSLSIFSKEKASQAVPFDTWYRNYSPLFDVGEAIKELSSKNQTLIVAPQNSLVYWQSGLLNNDPYFFTLNVMYEEPYVKNVVDAWQKNPPDFAFMDGVYNDKYYTPLLQNGYTRLLQNGEPSKIYVRNETFAKINEVQWKKAERYGYFKP